MPRPKPTEQRKARSVRFTEAELLWLANHGGIQRGTQTALAAAMNPAAQPSGPAFHLEPADIERLAAVDPDPSRAVVALLDAIEGPEAHPVDPLTCEEAGPIETPTEEPPPHEYTYADDPLPPDVQPPDALATRRTAPTKPQNGRAKPPGPGETPESSLDPAPTPPRAVFNPPPDLALLCRLCRISVHPNPNCPTCHGGRPKPLRRPRSPK